MAKSYFTLIFHICLVLGRSSGEKNQDLVPRYRSTLSGVLGLGLGLGLWVDKLFFVSQTKKDFTKIF